MDARVPETGVVGFFDPERRFGFIEPDDGSADLYFVLRPGEEPVEAGDMVVFERRRTPIVTPTGPAAHRVRRIAFQTVERATAPELAPVV
jgi:cold shock CspA family protein